MKTVKEQNDDSIESNSDECKLCYKNKQYEKLSIKKEDDTIKPPSEDTKRK